MIPLGYWLMRLARRATPQPVVDFLLDRGIVLKPGADTSDPEGVAKGYARYGIAGKTVCVVGYGGSLGVGLHLVDQGAARVILQDPYAPVRRARNRALPASLLRHRDRLTFVHAPLDAVRERADLVVSSSVLEHVADLDRLLAACARLGGLNVHTIDLRDHVFRYPFEMLCYREPVWRRLLDASNHLNRLRLPAYERAFRAHFAEVRIEVLERLPDEFRRARPRIRPEFLTGDEDIDAASIIRVECR